MFGLFNRKNESIQSVRFNQEVADKTLLDVIEKELRTSQIDFSDLCKEALWHYLCVPASMQPQDSQGDHDDLRQLQAKLAELEKRLTAQQSSGFGAIEQRLAQISSQLGQINIPAYQPPAPAQAEPSVEYIPESEEVLPPEENPNLDPALSRISGLLDDF
jgi:hypothetical protein